MFSSIFATTLQMSHLYRTQADAGFHWSMSVPFKFAVNDDQVSGSHLRYHYLAGHDPVSVGPRWSLMCNVLLFLRMSKFRWLHSMHHQSMVASITAAVSTTNEHLTNTDNQLFAGGLFGYIIAVLSDKSIMCRHH
jgi:hypothetical protein